MPSVSDRLADVFERSHGTPLGNVLAVTAALLADKDPIKLLRIAAFALFCFPALVDSRSWAARVNQALMIWFHEGGHGAFMWANGWGFAGRFLCIAAGSGAQIAVPLLFMAAVASTGRRFDASLMGFWLGLNFLSVAVYAADAQDRAMPLILNLGPEAHDWGNMLTMLHLLPATPVIAGAIWLLGLLSFLGAIACGYLTAAPGR